MYTFWYVFSVPRLPWALPYTFTQSWSCEETRVIKTSEMHLTQELHAICAHHLWYSSLVEDLQKTVRFRPDPHAATNERTSDDRHDPTYMPGLIPSTTICTYFYGPYLYRIASHPVYHDSIPFIQWLRAGRSQWSVATDEQDKCDRYPPQMGRVIKRMVGMCCGSQPLFVKISYKTCHSEHAAPFHCPPLGYLASPNPLRYSRPNKFTADRTPWTSS